MKIHLLILIISAGILLCGNAMAKAVKLGRSNAYSIEAFSRFAGKTEQIEKSAVMNVCYVKKTRETALNVPKRKDQARINVFSTVTM